MRIVAGTYRGLALAALGKGDAGAHLRPTTDRVRESLFNVLAGGKFGDALTDARTLDLFAGTGALGLEALSRDGECVTFVDDGRKAQSLIEQNIAICKAGPKCKLIRADATRLPQNPDAPYDLVFLDPPYAKTMGEKAMAAALAGNWLTARALVVWEDSSPIIVPDALILLDTRKYGDTKINFLEPK
ncbi:MULTISPECIES: 16S rRNA (guanine(966)-N(2))-methyltransferase RsmD [Pacificibacter]|uniref:16S rRNA (guanine(966)-N(2))-methyltransferase RsmD n=1 Tax=Pacificibacter TaxID=1042323 RepID=UPI001C090FFD|nr:MULTISPECIES: 16S rRNA (guanine(966)-N(2))-methyltransferase RsmD [Pacificibacter]MBU2937314.1 16S rRNA (guanine(966)-N(2))-methyltransferase RsmD [Pacificibacter marinus]MDO6615309.1 16S rRNA (guanine(966)-N(2))-methyltransferase RsmD [Pacificibacter sp. 1_MG-2023]